MVKLNTFISFNIAYKWKSLAIPKILISVIVVSGHLEFEHYLLIEFYKILQKLIPGIKFISLKVLHRI